MPRRKSASSTRRFAALFPGTPGPHEADQDRKLREEQFPGESPRTTANIASLRKSLFKRSMSTEELRTLRNRTVPAAPSTTASSQDDQQQDAEIILDEAPRGGERTPPQRPLRHQPPDEEDVATRIATAIERVLGRQLAAAPAAQQHGHPTFRPPEIPVDPTRD